MRSFGYFFNCFVLLFVIQILITLPSVNSKDGMSKLELLKLLFEVGSLPSKLIQRVREKPILQLLGLANDIVEPFVTAAEVLLLLNDLKEKMKKEQNMIITKLPEMPDMTVQKQFMFPEFKLPSKPKLTVNFIKEMEPQLPQLKLPLEIPEKFMLPTLPKPKFTVNIMKEMDSQKMLDFNEPEQDMYSKVHNIHNMKQSYNSYPSDDLMEPSESITSMGQPNPGNPILLSTRNRPIVKENKQPGYSGKDLLTEHPIYELHLFRETPKNFPGSYRNAIRKVKIPVKYHGKH